MRIDRGPATGSTTAGTDRTPSSCWPAERRAVRRATARRRYAGWRAYRREKRRARQPHGISEYLRTPEDVAAYFNAAIEECDRDPRLLMKAFRDVAAAQGGVSTIARRADIDRVALSRGLSEAGTPGWGR